jgi:hypothetical protein
LRASTVDAGFGRGDVGGDIRRFWDVYPLSRALLMPMDFDEVSLEGRAQECLLLSYVFPFYLCRQ